MKLTKRLVTPAIVQRLLHGRALGPVCSVGNGAARWLALVFLGVVLSQQTAMASGLSDALIDPEDGWLDAGKFLLDYRYGVLPVPFFITEPAVGIGGGIAAAYFHDSDGGAEQAIPNRPRAIPRSISAAAIGGTDNGSRFVAGGHFGYYLQDRIRYQGLLAFTDLNLDFYGGSEFENRDGYSFNVATKALYQSLAFRLGDSDWFAGAAYLFLSNDIEFDTDDSVPGVDQDMLDSDNASLSVFLQYDSLDGQYAPRGGWYSELRYASYDETWGGDFNYDRFTWKNQTHRGLGEDWTIGLRLDFDSVSGDLPFYGLPYIKLKGIPVMRYQGEKVVVAEARISWDFHPRLQASFFSGVGKAAPDLDELGDSPSRISNGLGLRYMLVRKLGLSVGLDYAWGPEEEVVYISVGTRWM